MLRLTPQPKPWQTRARESRRLERTPKQVLQVVAWAGAGLLLNYLGVVAALGFLAR
jgi:hypothetical protein